MQPQLSIQGVNIVLRGQFNPAIFHPSWFAAQDLIRRQESEAAEIELIVPDAAIFNAEWLQMRVVRDRFQAGTTQEPYFEPLRDLVVGALELLDHTPLTVMGINREFQYRLESETAWHELGDRLTPKQDWEAVLDNPGMLSLRMQGKRSDNLEGYLQVKVEPSVRLEFGVFVQVNDHYRLSPDSEPPVGTSTAVNILSERWAKSLERSLEIAERIANLAE